MNVTCLLEYAGGLWFGTSEDGLLRQDLTSGNVSAAGNQLNIKCLYAPPGSTAPPWCGTGNRGLLEFKDGWVKVPFPLPGSDVRMVVRDGTRLWFATNSGLLRQHGNANKVFDEVDGLPNRRVKSVLTTDTGGVWCGTEGGLVYLLDDQLSVVEELKSEHITCLLRDQKGNLWCGTQKGVWRREAQVWSLVFETKKVRCLLEDPQGQVWCGTEKGLWVYAAEVVGQRVRVVKRTWRLVEQISGAVNCLCLDHSGQLWCGTEEGISLVLGELNPAAMSETIPKEVPPPSPSVIAAAVQLEPPVLQIFAGASAKGVIRLNRTNYKKPVQISLGNPPARATVLLSPKTTYDELINITVDTLKDVAPGDYVINLTATAEGITILPVQVAVTILPRPSLSLVVPRQTVLSPGEKTILTIPLERIAYAGPLTLSSRGVPPGLAVRFLTNPVTTQAELELTADVAVPGLHTFQILGSAKDITVEPISVTVKVTPRPSPEKKSTGGKKSLFLRIFGVLTVVVIVILGFSDFSALPPTVSDEEILRVAKSGGLMVRIRVPPEAKTRLSTLKVVHEKNKKLYVCNDKEKPGLIICDQDLPLGTYTLTIEYPGYRPFIIQGIEKNNPIGIYNDKTGSVESGLQLPRKFFGIW
ncbi:two-component regulator propeller domain-containing protein [Candidatus Cyanaurora vandensis]|uniref:two-component regulator propeller domain-containing protein n=1 Tax=Candidatus Cyanaurora vandensis TaxID=2714958 RepID=UPI00257DE5C8|nr:two-component regulator propeller domain-containing protein [Candidatus Cyanaurora vandensis]